jgi:SAM-dependent methyltransferase
VSTPDHFRRLYASGRVPWRFDTGWYERRKRSLLLAALPAERYGTVVEPGCATGHLTVELARRCDRLLAFDVSPDAVATTRDRIRALGGRAAGVADVSVSVAELPEGWPPGPRVDLAVLSEIGYYLTEPGLVRLRRAVEASLAPDGTVVACHWRHPAPDHRLTGDRVHELLGDAGWRTSSRTVEEDFVLQVWQPPGSASVARLEGLTG